MRNILQWAPAVAATAVLVLLVAWMAGVFDNRLAPGLKPRSDQAQQPAFRVVEELVAVTEPVPGSVEAKQATLVASRIIARIERILVRAGDTVRAGQLLLELEKTDLEARVAQAGNQITAARARFTEAERNLQRSIELQQRGLLSASDREAAQATRDSLQADLQRTEQGLEEARAALAYASIHSPLDGRVVDRFAEPGDMAAPGTTLLSLYNPLSLRVEASVREQLAVTLAVGQAVSVSLPALDSAVQGSIEEIVPAAEPGSRSFLVKIRLPSDDRLLPGLYARVDVPAGSERRMRVPEALLAQVGQLWVATVAGPEGPERRFLRVGKRDGDGRVEVVAGLQAGDELLPLAQSSER